MLIFHQQDNAPEVDIMFEYTFMDDHWTGLKAPALDNR